MKLSHATALALVGWYLMVPTPYGARDLRYVQNLPLSRWTVFQSFDNADDCEQVKAAMIEQFLPMVPHGDPNASKSAGRLAFLYTQAQCISSDDPRLKGN